MTILLCQPRLDLPFKDFGNGIPAQDYSNLQPIRQHWANIYKDLAQQENVTEIVLPMWQFTDEFYLANHHKFDGIIVPHRQKLQFSHLGGVSDKMLFLMQTVIPELFTLDPMGWGANLSFLPMKFPTYDSATSFDYRNFIDHCESRIACNVSKFNQPEPTKTTLENYFDVLFVCQIPHDETIKFHSDISVADALRYVLDTAKIKNYKVLVKGHPVNMASMEPLRQITMRYDNATWTDNRSIFDAIRASKVVALVNSGVGFEAMMMGKPIFSYGRSEYQNVVNYKKEVDINGPDMIDYWSFLYHFFEHHTITY